MSLLRLDYTNCLASAIGATHGLTDAELDTLIAKIPKHHENVAELETVGESCWFSLPSQDLAPLKALVKAHAGKYEALVIVGVGGAAVSIQCVLGTLLPRTWNELPASARKKAPRVLYIDNADPLQAEEVLAAIDPKKTLFLVVSRSGHSCETNALLLYLEAWLKKTVGKDAGSQMLVLTEGEKSPLVDVCNKDKLTLVPVPENLGDRYAVFGLAALLPAALCGIDVDDFLAGARALKERTWHGNAWQNPAYMHALIHYLLTRKRRKTIHATVAFHHRLQGFCTWYDHLLAASLGKMLNRKGKAVHVGPGPSSCVAPSGMHGTMQLHAEGPFDKVVSFITVKDHVSDFTIPKAHPKNDALAFLGGQNHSDILRHSYLTAVQDLTASGRPSMTFELDTLSPGALGGLCYVLMLSTVMSAELYGIDPFNQPLIDNAKQSVSALCGRPGFEDRAATLRKHLELPRKTC